jgi:hypothetical protein
MRRFRPALLSLLTLSACLIFPGTALANSNVIMKLTGVGGNSAGGVYTYPYYFSINGGAPVALICDSYDNEVVIGETWRASKSSLLSGRGMFGNELLDYKAAGLIFKSILNGTMNVNIGNYAIWGLFSNNAQSSSFFKNSAISSVETEYLTIAATAPNSAFQGLVLYTPVPGTQSWGGTAQEYIGYSPAPEPGTLALFGTGLIFLAGVMRRRLSKAKFIKS